MTKRPTGAQTGTAHPAETTVHSYSDLAARILDLERGMAELEAKVAQALTEMEALRRLLSPDPRVAE